MWVVKIILIFKGVYLLKSFIFIAGNVLVECNKITISTTPLQNTKKTPSQLKETTNAHVTTAHHISETTIKEEHKKRFLMNHGSSDHNSLSSLFHTVLCKLFSFRKSTDFYNLAHTFQFICTSYVMKRLLYI